MSCTKCKHKGIRHQKNGIWVNIHVGQNTGYADVIMHNKEVQAINMRTW